MTITNSAGNCAYRTTSRAVSLHFSGCHSSPTRLLRPTTLLPKALGGTIFFQAKYISLQRLQHKGGDVQVYLPEPAQFRADIQPKITASAATLQRAGIPVMFCPDRLPNFCILDQRLVWYGGLNPLGRMPANENSLRMTSPGTAAELMEFLHGIMPSG